LKGYEPALLRLPFFLLRLGTEVDWGAECECFNGIAKELALLYQVWDNSLYQSGITNKTLPDVSWMIQHVLLPSMKSGFSAPSQLSSNGAVIQIAALERC
jgi:DNA mismatch repair protein MLH1